MSGRGVGFIKISAMALVFTLPIVVVLYFIISSIAYDIRFSNLEIYGNRFQKPLESLLYGVGEYSRLREFDSSNFKINKFEKMVDEAFESLSNLYLEIGKDLQFTEDDLSVRGRSHLQPICLKEKWEKIKSSSEITKDIRELYLSLLSDILELIGYLGNTSNLVLDPDLDSYYLMDIVLLVLPQEQYKIMEIMYYAEEYFNENESYHEGNLLAFNIYSSFIKDSYYNRIISSTYTVLDEDKNFYGVSKTLKENIESALASYSLANENFLEVLNNLSDKETANSVSRQDFILAAEKALAQSFSYWEVCSNELDTLVRMRIRHFIYTIGYRMVMVLIVVLATVLLFSYVRIRENEKRLRYALAGANEGLWDWDINTGEVYYSKRWCSMLGYNKDEIQRDFEGWQSLIHPDDRNSFIKKIESHLNGKTQYYQDGQRLRKKDGSYLWVLSSGMIVERDNKGKPKRMVGTNLDIHVSKTLEEKVRRDLIDKRNSIMKAQEVQKRLNTKKIPRDGQVRISALYMPSEELSGDFFNIIKTRDNSKMVVFLGDSTGHGIEASMDATLLKSICDRYIDILEKDSATDKFLGLVNRDIVKYTVDEKYPTLFVCVINLDTLDMFYSSANAPLPVVICDTPYVIEKVKGFHLGFFDNVEFETKSINLKGKRILISSDSIFEFLDEDGTVFNFDCFLKLCRNTTDSGQKYMLNLISSLDNITELPLEDDLTLILIEAKEPYKDKMYIRSIQDLDEYINDFKDNLYSFSCDSEQISKICAVLYELGTNAIKHGNKDSESKIVKIEVNIDCLKVEIRITDEGDGFDPKSIKETVDFKTLLKLLDEDNESEYTHGRGIWLAREYSSSLTYNEKGNSVFAVVLFKDENVLSGI